MAHRNLVAFLYELRAKLASSNRSLILMADIGLDSTDLQQLARTVDYIITDTYDQTANKLQAGPVVAQGWFKSRVSEIASKIDRSKLIIGIGSYGYEWKQGVKKYVSVQYVWDKVSLSAGQIRFDAQSLVPAFQYHSDNVRNDIWCLDAVTAFNQMRSALSVNPAGVAIWRMGLEDPGVWSFVKRDRFPDDEAVLSLSQITAGIGAFTRLHGPLLAIGHEQNGKRELTYNQASGLITNEVLSSIPRQTNIVPMQQGGQGCCVDIR